MSAGEDLLIAAALRVAADLIDGVIAGGDIAECAAPVEGEQGREACIESRDALYEDPAGWLRNQADELSGLCGEDPVHEGWKYDTDDCLAGAR